MVLFPRLLRRMLIKQPACTTVWQVLQPQVCLQWLSCHPSSCSGSQSSPGALARKPRHSISLMQLAASGSWAVVFRVTLDLSEVPGNDLLIASFWGCWFFHWKSPLAQSGISYLKSALCQYDSEGSVKCRDLVQNVTAWCKKGVVAPELS